MAMKGREYANIVFVGDEVEGERSSPRISTATMDNASARLFLAWSDGHELTHDDTAPPSAEHDRGLWLLLGADSRQRNWLRLTAETLGQAESWAPASVYEAAKRVIDVAMASALLVLTAPLMLIVSLLVRLDSPGPAFFSQRRVGRLGEPFKLWKFRSMHADTPKYAPSPNCDRDSRVTRVGRVIRRASLDEIPQLINVLRGEMSLVGPRPEMPFIVEGYTPRERQRLAVKPGITGLWQISPARARPIHENVDYDLYYIRYRNLAFDAAILLRTILAVVRGVGAV